MEPVAVQMRLPEGYGTPTRLLEWRVVRQRLEGAEQYWLATTRPDGRPHVVPVDGVWVGGVWYFGGAAGAIHQRNLEHNRHITVHLADPVAAVIAEGTAERRTPESRKRVTSPARRGPSTATRSAPPTTRRVSGACARRSCWRGSSSTPTPPGSCSPRRRRRDRPAVTGA